VFDYSTMLASRRRKPPEDSARKSSKGLRPRLAKLVVVVLSLLALAGCGGKDTGTSAPAPPSPSARDSRPQPETGRMPPGPFDVRPPG
jgi:hypothetical protein